jgi:DNA-binding MarR family transcriptional regulator
MSTRQRALALALPDPAAPDAQRVLLFRLLLANAHELRTRMDRLLAESGLTTQQAMVLQFLEGEPTPPTLTQLAARIGTSHQNLKQIASALVRKRLVRIAPDRDDGRVRRLHLTAKHHRLWQDRNPDDFAAVGAWTSALNDSQVRDSVKLLDALHASLTGER